ncbi:MAG: glycosyl hydrolase [Eubacteriales bacterium]
MKQTIESIRSLAPSYGSIPFWSWNDKLEEPELRRQIRDMKKLGMNGFFMHARGGLETEYLSDEWFDCINVCVDEARKLGMEAWSYDENGWPSGFAGGELLKDKKNFALAVEHKDGPFPELNEDIIAVYRKNADGSFTRVTEDVGDPEYLILYKRYDESYVDTLDGSITDKFIEATHEEYKKRIAADDFGSGKPMPGFFTDEPQYYRWGNPYSNTLPGEFRKAYGYDLLDKLPAVFFDFDGADKFRYDYYLLIHKLFINNFIKKIYDWCEANGAEITGHAVEESSLGGQMMCIGGVMPFYQYEHIPGIDYLGRGIADDIAPKQLGSACAQLGRKKAISEMFGCCGWDVSPTELKRIAELQYASGVNLMCQHLYPYSERGQRKRDYPLHYSEHNPWQAKMKEFDHYFNNLGAALAQGEEYAPILVLHPIHGAYCKYKKNTDSLHDIEGKFFELSRLLGENQIPYHYGDEWMIADMAEVVGDTIRLGCCTYRAVIVPFTYSLDRTTVELLKKYSENGGKVWLFADVPPYIDGEAADLSWLKSTVTFDDLMAMRDVVITKNGQKVPQIRKMTRVIGDERLVYLTNVRTDALYPVKVTLPAGKWAALNMDTLETAPLCFTETNGMVEATLSFADGQSYVLVSGADLPDTASAADPKPVNDFIPVPRTVALTKPVDNVMTLDIASLSKDGVTYDEPLSVMGIKDNLLRERYDGRVWLKFTYEADDVPANLRVAVEPMYERVLVNGVEVVPEKDKPWFDRSFATADIAALTKVGTNEIVIEVNHHQRDYVYYVLYSGVSESLRNCLVFDVEIENIYLIGDFALRCNGEFTDSVRSSVLYDGGFTLVAQPKVVPARDIVRGGFPFYGGEISTKFTYRYAPGKATVLKLDGRFATADITVNGTFAGTMLFERTLDLAKWLNEGDNDIEVTLCNSMRNAMGPHHRSDPEPYGVGPGTFSFEKEWNGRECRGYVERYAFVRYGMKK